MWFVDTHTSSSPLVFPNTECPWMPPLRVVTPQMGNIVVFDANEYHYVPPVTDGHIRVTVSGNMILNNEGVFQQQQ